MPQGKDDCTIIGVDTGNRCIKTATQVTVAGLFESESKPTFFDKRAIFYKGKYYQLSSGRSAYRRDKTTDDYYFILTLSAIMSELKVRSIPFGHGAPVPRIILGVGLPPAHMPMQREAFKKYFMRGTVDFEYGDTPVSIEIVDVYVCVQGYSAIYAHMPSIRQYPSSVVVDIGGYTTDVFEMEYTKVNPHCISENAGMIHLYSKIADEMNVRYDTVPKEDLIDRLLFDTEFELEPGMKELAQKIAAQYVSELLRHLNEKGIDLKLSKCIFVGGGSARLQKYILESKMVRDPLILTDVKANALGYEDYIKRFISATQKKS